MDPHPRRLVRVIVAATSLACAGAPTTAPSGSLDRVENAQRATRGSMRAAKASIQSADCASADQLLADARSNPSKEVPKLREAIRLCPEHVRAINDLGVALEERGKLDEASRLYNRAINLDAGFPEPHAGLGDILLKQGRVDSAENEYQAFVGMVRSLPPQRQRDYSRALRVYQRKLDGLRSTMLRRATAGEASRFVSAQSIVRGIRLKRTASEENHQERSKLGLIILFEPNSDEIHPASWEQIIELETALQSDALRSRRIQIEGHTDDTGPEEYNLALSKKRAERVRRALVMRGVSTNRLTAVGYGESSPAAPGDTPQARAANRRVRLVDIGGE